MAKENITLPTVSDLPPPNKSVKVYQDALRRLQPTETALDVKMGWVAWVKGQILQRAQESNKASGAKFDKLCEDFGIPRSTAYHYIAIAKQYPDPKDVQGKTQSELRNRIRGNGGGSTRKGNGRRRIRVTVANLRNKLDLVLRTVVGVTKIQKGTAHDKHVGATYKAQRAVLQRIIERCQESIRLFDKRLAALDKVAQQKRKAA